MWTPGEGTASKCCHRLRGTSGPWSIYLTQQLPYPPDPIGASPQAQVSSQEDTCQDQVRGSDSDEPRRAPRALRQAADHAEPFLHGFG